MKPISTSFLLDVSCIDDESKANDSEISNVVDQVELNRQKKHITNKNNYIFYLSLILLPIIVIIGVIFSWQIIRVPQAINQVEALTRDPGRESRGQVSPNGKYLDYIGVRDKKMHQWIRSLTYESKIEINHGNEQSVWVDSVSWNSDGSEG